MQSLPIRLYQVRLTMLDTAQLPSTSVGPITGMMVYYLSRLISEFNVLPTLHKNYSDFL